MGIVHLSKKLKDHPRTPWGGGRENHCDTGLRCIMRRVHKLHAPGPYIGSRVVVFWVGCTRGQRDDYNIPIFLIGKFRVKITCACFDIQYISIIFSEIINIRDMTIIG